MKKVIIAGTSDQAKVIIDIFEKSKSHAIVGLVDKNKKSVDEILGYKVLGNDEDLPRLLSINAECEVFVAIGDNGLREQVKSKILAASPEVVFANAIHPSAQIGKNVQIGKGIAIMAGAIINSSSSIGDFCVINTRASLDHDCKMSAFSSLGPNATTGGNVTIGNFSAIAISATVIHGVSVGTNTIIGAGSVLLKTCGDDLVLYGIPAKNIRKRKSGDPYL